MQLVPVPTTPEHLDASFPFWSPFLADIAKRSKQTVAELMEQVARIEVQPILIWDEEQKKATGLIGVRYHRRNGGLVAELVWFGTIRQAAPVRQLLADLEKYLIEQVGVVEIKPICRPGLVPLFERHGYQVSHCIMEKATRHAK